jgi:hypothetical protein
MTAVDRAVTAVTEIERLLGELKIALTQAEYSACVVCGLRRVVLPGRRVPRTCGSRCRKRLSRSRLRDAQA